MKKKIYETLLLNAKCSRHFNAYTVAWNFLNNFHAVLFNVLVFLLFMVIYTSTASILSRMVLLQFCYVFL